MDDLSLDLADLSRRELLADDVFIPRSDTLVFEGRHDTEVHLIDAPGTVR